MPSYCPICGGPLDNEGYCTDECEDTDNPNRPIDEPDRDQDPDVYWDDRNEPDIY